MATVLLALEVYATVEQLHKIYTDNRQRFENASRNPAIAAKLAHRFENLQRQLAPLARESNNNTFHFQPHHLSVFNNRIHQLARIINQTTKQLNNKIAKLNSPFYSFVRATIVSEWLSEVEALSHDADKILSDITAVFANASLITKGTQATSANTTALTHNTAAIQQYTHTITTSNNNNKHPQQPDLFSPSFLVPNDPSHVVLHFQSISDLQTHAHPPPTIESKLKSAVIRSDGTQSIAAVGLEGMSGVGKSCALRGLAKDSEVQHHFRHGAYFITLGKEATEADVVRQVAKIISASGGPALAKEVMEENDTEEAVSKARRWFGDKSCLLLIDDVWEDSEAGRDIIPRLSSAVDIASGSRVVFTTRDMRVAMRSENIHFAERDTDVSLGILLAAADLHRSDIDAVKPMVDHVLQFCNGLPMALAVAGSTIKGKLVGNPRSEMKEMLEEYLHELRAHREYLLHETVDSDAYGNLASAFMASLSALDANMSEKLPFHSQMLFSDMYRALFVLKRQGWIPVNILTALWETEDEFEAIKVMQKLVEGNLAQRENRTMNGRRMPGITLHDLHLDFVHAECKRHRESQKWHRKLLHSFLPENNSAVTTGPSRELLLASHSSWVQNVLRDDYARSNVARHLLAAGMESDLNRLLRDPNWVVEKLRAQEIISLEEDVSLILEQSKGKHRAQTDPEDRGGWTLKMILGAAKLSSSYVFRNPVEAWYQMYGRLWVSSRESEAIKNFTKEIAVVAERPWLKTLSPCLPEPGGALQSTVLFGGPVLALSCDSDNVLTVCGKDESNQPFVSTIREGHVECIHLLSQKNTETNSTTDDNCSAACASPDVQSDIELMSVCNTRVGIRVIAARRNGNVQLWDGDNREMIWEAVTVQEGETSRVQHFENNNGFSLSPEAPPMTANSLVEDRVSDPELHTGDAYPCSPSSTGSEGHAWTYGSFLSESESLGRHSLDREDRSEQSNDAKSSASGVSLASATLSEPSLIRPLHLPWFRREDKGQSGLTGIACSNDEKFAISRQSEHLLQQLRDHAIHVWHFGSPESLDSAPTGPFDGASCVTWSRDGNRLALGTLNGEVEVWNFYNCELVSSTTLEQTVTCVALSANGKHLVSGSHSGDIAFLNADTGETINSHQEAHGDTVECLSWSMDGKYIASGSSDRLVRVWNTETMEPVGEVLQGHASKVVCVVWSADGKCVISGSLDRTVRIWEVETSEPKLAKQVEEEANSGNGITCMAWSTDGKRVAAGLGNGSMHAWDAETGQMLNDAHKDSAQGHKGAIRCCTWSGDGKRIATGSEDWTVRLWDGENGEALGDAIKRQSGTILSVGLSEDGRRLAAGSWDETVEVWDTATRKTLLSVFHGGEVLSVSLSGDGTRVVAGGDDGKVRLWNVDSGEVLRTLSGWIPDDTAFMGDLLGENGTAKAGEEEDIVTVKNGNVLYDDKVVGTLDADVGDWSYSKESNRLVVLSRNREQISFFELVMEYT